VVFLASAHEFTGFHGLSEALLVLGIIALVAWLAAFGYRWLRTRPDLPPAGPEISELPGNPESPAVVNFLVNNWRSTPTGVAATIIDLAARRILGIDLVGIDGTVIRLRDRPARGTLTGYEEQVYDLVASRATGGSAPIEAITLDEGAADGWIRRFEKAVVKEARDKGLARKRWERIDYFVVGVGLAFVLGFFAGAFALAHVGASSSPGSDSNISASDWLVGAGMAWLAAMGMITRSQAVTDTPAGKVVCARWMGLRDYFRHSHAFDDQPPASVAIWDRLLAYGVAAGTARDAAEGVKVVAEDPHTAWTRASGDWREVRIEYPVRFGFGQSPVKVFFDGIVRTLFWGGIAYVIVPIIAVVGWRALQDALDDTNTSLPTGSREFTVFIAVFGVAVVLVGVYLTARTLGGLIRLVRGARDLGKRVTVEGEVVKVHQGRFAVDDGKRSSVAALFVPPQPGVARGQRVRAVISPHLKHLSTLTVLSASPAAPVAGVAEAGQPVNLSVEALSAATGLNLRLAADGSGGSSGPRGTFVRRYEDGAGHYVSITRLPSMAAHVPLASIITKFATRGGQPVEGVGDSATWAMGRALVVTSGDEIWAIDVDFETATPERRLEIARGAASALLAG